MQQFPDVRVLPPIERRSMVTIAAFFTLQIIILVTGSDLTSSNVFTVRFAEFCCKRIVILHALHARNSIKDTCCNPYALSTNIEHNCHEKTNQFAFFGRLYLWVKLAQINLTEIGKT